MYEDQLLLWIHPACFTLWNVEKAWVEAALMLDIAAPHGNLERLCLTDEPTTASRRIADGGTISVDETPIGVKTFCTWKVTTHPCDNDHGGTSLYGGAA
jgi:hypothetical protein